MSIVVIGSSNTDMVVNVGHIPQEGETVLGSGFSIHKGGKGANQAVAAARLGGDVTYIANIGNDEFGDNAISSYEKECINTDHIYRDGNTSGVALIMVSDESGKNCIAVSPESNNLLSPQNVSDKSEIIKNADVVLVQLETPIETVEKIAQIISDTSTTFILNPAPGRALSDELLSRVDVITPNETEAEILTGVKVTDESTASKAAKILCEKGVATTIITRGSQGAYIYSKNHSQLVPAKKVKAVDTTAAGDTFNGALAKCIVSGESIYKSNRVCKYCSSHICD